MGGYLTTTAGWRWVFAVNVPIGALGVAAATRWLRDIGFREHRPLAWRALLVAVVLAPAAVGAAVTMPVGGRLADRVGPRIPVVAGGCP